MPCDPVVVADQVDSTLMQKYDVVIGPITSYQALQALVLSSKALVHAGAKGSYENIIAQHPACTDANKERIKAIIGEKSGEYDISEKVARHAIDTAISQGEKRDEISLDLHKAWRSAELYALSAETILAEDSDGKRIFNRLKRQIIFILEPAFIKIDVMHNFDETMLLNTQRIRDDSSVDKVAIEIYKQEIKDPDLSPDIWRGVLSKVAELVTHCRDEATDLQSKLDEANLATYVEWGRVSLFHIAAEKVFRANYPYPKPQAP